MKTLIKCKNIKLDTGKTFIYRLSIYLKSGSIKLHLICEDDLDKLHTHPWDFTSLILFGGYKEYDSNNNIKHFRFLSRNRKHHSEYHKVQLYRLFGYKIPCLTIGRYSNKKQLCSLCTQLGYCMQNKQH